LEDSLQSSPAHAEKCDYSYDQHAVEPTLKALNAVSPVKSSPVVLEELLGAFDETLTPTPAARPAAANEAVPEAPVVEVSSRYHQSKFAVEDDDEDFLEALEAEQRKCAATSQRPVELPQEQVAQVVDPLGAFTADCGNLSHWDRASKAEAPKAAEVAAIEPKQAVQIITDEMELLSPKSLRHELSYVTSRIKTTTALIKTTDKPATKKKLMKELDELSARKEAVTIVRSERAQVCA